MNAQTEQAGNGLDILKWVVVGLTPTKKLPRL